MGTTPSTKPSWLDMLVFERMHLIFGLFTVFLILPACASTRYITQTKKSGVEQLLVAKAVDRALCGESLNLEGARIFIDVASLMVSPNHCYTIGYAKISPMGQIRSISLAAIAGVLLICLPMKPLSVRPRCGSEKL